MENIKPLEKYRRAQVRVETLSPKTAAPRLSIKASGFWQVKVKLLGQKYEVTENRL